MCVCVCLRKIELTLVGAEQRLAPHSQQWVDSWHAGRNLSLQKRTNSLTHSQQVIWRSVFVQFDLYKHTTSTLKTHIYTTHTKKSTLYSKYPTHSTFIQTITLQNKIIFYLSTKTLHLTITNILWHISIKTQRMPTWWEFISLIFRVKQKRTHVTDLNIRDVSISSLVTQSSSSIKGLCHFEHQSNQVMNKNTELFMRCFIFHTALYLPDQQPIPTPGY